MNRSSLLCCSAVTVAIACNGNIGTDTRPAPSPELPSSTPPSTFTPAEVRDASSRCSDAHGVPQPYATVDALVAQLSGTWLYCPDGEPLAGVGTVPARVGIEFTSDGHFYWLSPDESGAVTRGQGIRGIGAYEIAAPVTDVVPQITVWFPDRSQWDTGAVFEREPRRLAMDRLRWFVPLTKAQ